MRTTHSRLMAVAALSAVLLVGCGSNDDDNNAGSGGPQGPAAQTVTDIVAFINNLIAGTSNSSEPIDINSLTLTADNSADPAPLP